ncbi:IS2, transposase orfB, truncation [Escherichia coli]|uniref:hypothetical protein n=2 Tax=Escherichia coli TaxID=562 RepID=UPI000DA4CA5C|nr:hypothetical protein [Escherichia coli]MDA6220320.1 hypothetical protein [Escherichia coli]GDW60245.1 hypothetical protein BvCmsSIP002_04848 [Escherichia coli]SQO91137.1 IS2, transposase orfB, truncation [Escherichia coli]
MILSVFITVISGHDKPQPPGCLLDGKKTVTVREIRANSEYTDSMVGFKTPVLNDFTGECFKRQIKDFGDELAIKIEDFETAYKTLPEEKHRFSSYY